MPKKAIFGIKKISKKKKIAVLLHMSVPIEKEHSMQILGRIGPTEPPKWGERGGGHSPTYHIAKWGLHITLNSTYGYKSKTDIRAENQNQDAALISVVHCNTYIPYRSFRLSKRVVVVVGEIASYFPRSCRSPFLSSRRKSIYACKEEAWRRQR